MSNIDKTRGVLENRKIATGGFNYTNNPPSSKDQQFSDGFEASRSKKPRKAPYKPEKDWLRGWDEYQKLKKLGLMKDY